MFTKDITFPRRAPGKLTVSDCKRKSSIQSLFCEPWFSTACEEFMVLDIETTGLHNVTDQIVEVSALHFKNCVEVDSFVSIVNPQRPIPAGATAVHGITDDMVRDAPLPDAVLPELLAFLGTRLVVGHYVNFDLGFIEIGARRIGFDPSWNYIDTISVAKKLIPGLQNYKQQTVLSVLGYTQKRAHRAEDDCRGCAHIMLFGIEQIRAQGL